MGMGGLARVALLSASASMTVLGCGDDAAPAADGSSEAEPPDGSIDGAVDDGARDGADDDADAGDGAVGPTCIDRSELPEEAAPTLSTAGCSLMEACGGDIEGVDWQISDVCVTGLELAPEVLAVCSAARIISVSDPRATGQAALEGGALELAASASASLMLDMPNACHGCRCADLEGRLTSAGLAASCNPVCSGGSCTCTVNASFNFGVAEDVTEEGGELVTEGGERFSYCVDGEQLTVVDPSGRRYRFRPPSRPLLEFEICDGEDNDDNGSVDDDPQDCSGCPALGLCAGPEPTCDGAAGWTCTYPDAYEAEESLCDGLDNDCDGEVDEPTECIELCDGIDNDENDVVDDSLDDTPVCATRGECRGVSVRCFGAAGYRCEGHADTHEGAEVSCDGLDNDCDGALDEPCASCSDADKALYYTVIGDETTTGLYRADIDGEGGTRIVPIERFTFTLAAPVVTAEHVYFVADGGVFRCDRDGENVEHFYEGDVGAFAVDHVRGHFYVSLGYEIWRGPISAPRRAVKLLEDSVRDMMLDLGAGHLYWTTSGGVVRRSNLGGFAEESLPIPEVPDVHSVLAFDPVGQRIFFGASVRLGYVDLDFSEAEVIATSPEYSQAFDLDIDVGAGKVYWVEPFNERVLRANLDGTGIEDVLTEVRVTGIALDLCPTDEGGDP